MEKETWFKPYKDFDIGNQLDFLKFVSEEDGEDYNYPPIPFHLEIAFHEGEDWSISFLDADTYPGDLNKSPYSELGIYYPFGVPHSEEIEPGITRTDNGMVVDRIKSFGDLVFDIACCESDFITFLDKRLFPFGIFIKTPIGTFYSLPDLNGISVIDEEDRKDPKNDLEVLYDLWKPYETSEPAGSLYVPLNLPSLKVLEFKLSRLEPGFIYENIAAFSYQEGE